MKLILLLSLFFLVPNVQAAPAFDAYSNNGALVAGDVSYTHTPIGTPRGVVVYVISAQGSDNVTGVTYGGVAMTEVTGSPNSNATLPATVYAYFLGSGIPTGAQTVLVSTTGSVNKSAHTITITASADTELVNAATINVDSQANPSVSVSLTGRTSFVSIGIASGQNAVNGITPLTNWTARNEADIGAQTTAIYTYDIIGATDVTAGWTQTADVALAITSAVAEISGAAADDKFHLTGAGYYPAHR